MKGVGCSLLVCLLFFGCASTYQVEKKAPESKDWVIYNQGEQTTLSTVSNNSSSNVYQNDFSSSQNLLEGSPIESKDKRQTKGVHNIKSMKF